MFKKQSIFTALLTISVLLIFVLSVIGCSSKDDDDENAANAGNNTTKNQNTNNDQSNNDDNDDNDDNGTQVENAKQMAVDAVDLAADWSCKLMDCLVQNRLYKALFEEIFGEDLPDSHAECTQNFKSDTSMEEVESQFASGRITYDAEKAAECLNTGDLTSLESCEDFIKNAEEKCSGAIQGTQEEGEVCFEDMECKGKNYSCTANEGQCGVCEKLAELGEQCGIKDCVSNAHCDMATQTCVKNVEYSLEEASWRTSIQYHRIRY